MAAEAIYQMRLHEFIAWEREQTERHEYINGEIYDMAGGSYTHSDIAANIMIEIGSQLRGSDCKPKASDLAVLAGTRYVYPDVVINCGKPEFYDADEHILTNPVVLFEVLSPSTEKKDRGSKLDAYQRIPSLMAYVLVSQDRPRVEIYTRYNATQWLYTAYINLDTVLTLDCIGCKLPLSDIYRGITFLPEEDDEPLAP